MQRLKHYWAYCTKSPGDGATNYGRPSQGETHDKVRSRARRASELGSVRACDCAAGFDARRCGLEGQPEQRLLSTGNHHAKRRLESPRHQSLHQKVSRAAFRAACA
jgi:hypothetical protein